MLRPVPKVGDVVLVENDFSTPEDWEYPGTTLNGKPEDFYIA